MWRHSYVVSAYITTLKVTVQVLASGCQYSYRKGRVSIKGFSWYLNMSIIFWEQITTYRGHASLKTLNQMELWFCVYYVLKVGGVFMHQSYRR